MARLYKRSRHSGGCRNPELDPGFRRGDDIVILVSGGLDSAVLLGEAACSAGKVYPVYVRQGLAWESVELFWLKRFLRALKNSRIQRLRIFSIPMQDVYAGHWSLSKKVPGYRSKDQAVYLPGRNLVLLVKAAIFAAREGIHRIALGSLGHNPFPDARPVFFKQWAKTLGHGLSSAIRIETPYRHMSKVAVLRRGKDFPLEWSFSCLAPVGKKHCGRCNKCAERQKAFKAAGLPDRTLYEKR